MARSFIFGLCAAALTGVLALGASAQSYTQDREHQQYLQNQAERDYQSSIMDLHNRQEEATRDAWWKKPLPQDDPASTQRSVVATYTYIIYQHQDPIPVFTERANNGDAQAARGLGEMYATGYGAPQDAEQSAAWYGKAADLGDTESQAIYGMLLITGNGVPRDAARGAVYLQAAADKGDITATANLGLCYELGDGVSQDSTEAARLYRIAADQGNAAAETGLGRYEILGEGVPQDVNAGAAHLKAAADQGNVYAQAFYGVLLIRGLGDTPAAPYEAFRLLKLAAEKGSTMAQSQLAGMYNSGTGTDADIDSAIYWWQKAAENDDVDALANLAITYYNGAGVPQDLQKALYYAQRAAALGDQQMAGMAQQISGS